MATVREKPTGPTSLPKCTVAMPPDAISSKRVYRPITLGLIAGWFAVSCSAIASQPSIYQMGDASGNRPVMIAAGAEAGDDRAMTGNAARLEPPAIPLGRALPRAFYARP